jgi:hypothetical protein
MSSAAVIINGIRFPFYLVDHAINWARERSAVLYFMFLSRQNESQHIDTATHEDVITLGAEPKDIEAIHQQMQAVRDMALAEKLSVGIVHHPGATVDQVLEEAGEFGKIFLDGDKQPSLLGSPSFDTDELLKKTSLPLEFISPSY